MSTEIQSVLDDLAIRRLALGYAQAVDRLDELLLRSVFAADAVLDSKSWRYEGIDAICSILPILEENFTACWHAVHNQTVNVNGDEAHGETYCTARQLRKRGNGDRVMTITCRYQDRFARTAYGWRIVHRHQIVDWVEESTIRLASGS